MHRRLDTLDTCMLRRLGTCMLSRCSTYVLGWHNEWLGAGMLGRHDNWLDTGLMWLGKQGLTLMRLGWLGAGRLSTQGIPW